MGRVKRWAEDMQARFVEGTFARIAAVLRPSEDRTDFVREAVDHELARREHASRRVSSQSPEELTVAGGKAMTTENRNYDKPTVSAEWALSHGTCLAVAVAIHAISDDTRSPEAIVSSPTPAELHLVAMAVQEYVEHGDFPYELDGYEWGLETVRF